MVDSKLLEILVCPSSRQPVHEAEAELIKKINELISQNKLNNRSGDAVTENIDNGLVTEDNKFLYPIRDDIPIMLSDDAIPLEQL